MYKECRTYASTGDAWAEPFLREEMRWLQPLRAAALRFDPRWKAISRNIPRGARILDAGCGISPWPLFLYRNGYRAAGLDFSERMISLVSQRYPAIEWMSGSVQSIPAPDESFDGIISWGVIEHDENGPQQALSEFDRILKPGGRMVLTVPIDSARSRRSSEIQFAGPDALTFFQYFMSPDEFTRSVTDAGFRVREPVVAVSRHHALTFPRLYTHLHRYPAHVGRVCGWALKPIIALDEHSISMIMLVAEKPI